jgi:hypothetical protein
MRPPFANIASAAAVFTAFGSAVQAQELPALPEPMEASAAGDSSTVAEKQLVSLGTALAAANAELESLREQHAQLVLQMEALGIAAIKADERSLQQRLLKAASDLDASARNLNETTERATRLAEAAAAFMARPSDSALKGGLDQAIRQVTEPKQNLQSDAVSLEAARVVSYKAELGLAVVNAGRDSGVRIGAPVHIMRAGRSIASGLAVDVRDRIAGILLTDASAGQVRVGDAVKPELTNQSPK